MMSAHTEGGEKTHRRKNRTKRHSLVKMMNWARCYNDADATWHILWGLSSCAFLFPSEIRAAAEISLILTKHLCHIINTSQSCLSPRKDSNSSVLRFAFHSVFVLRREKSYFSFLFLFICLFWGFIFFGVALFCSVNEYWGIVHAFFRALLIFGLDSLQLLFFCPFYSLSTRINKEALDMIDAPP